MDFFFRKKDIVLWAALLLIIVFSLLLSFLLRGSTGSRATISVDNNEYATFSLLEDRTEVVIGYDSLTCTLEIKDGVANVTHADCPDKICVSHRPISKVGECIVCLPARIIVRIEGESEEIVPDTISR